MYFSKSKIDSIEKMAHSTQYICRPFFNCLILIIFTNNNINYSSITAIFIKFCNYIYNNTYLYNKNINFMTFGGIYMAKKNNTKANSKNSKAKTKKTSKKTTEQVNKNSGNDMNQQLKKILLEKLINKIK